MKVISLRGKRWEWREMCQGNILFDYMFIWHLKLRTRTSIKKLNLNFKIRLVCYFSSISLEMEVADFLNILPFHCQVIYCLIPTLTSFPSSEKEVSLVVSEVSRQYHVLDPTSSHIFHDLAPSTISIFSWTCHHLSFSCKSFPQTYKACLGFPHPINKQMNLSSTIHPILSLSFFSVT